jgi:nitrile hydratase beta subunit
MNGIHDLGGMTCFGPVLAEADEPVFHSDWERRVFAINVAAGGALGSIDYRRHGIERLAPVEYLRASYYEKWLARVELLAVETGLVSGEELASGVAAEPGHSDPADPRSIEAVIRRGRPASRSDGRQQPRFTVGTPVRARNLHPQGHTRLPRYVRGRLGRVHAIHGSHVFPDTNAHQRGEQPQPLYSVEFAATELWGPDVNRRDRLYIDLWEDYLEPVEPTP